MYEALQNNDTERVQEVLLEALEQVKFGRDNYGCPESNTDIEPPNLFIRAILDLNYLTYREFAWLLWKLEDIGANYTDSIQELSILRMQGPIQLGDEANKYADCKPINLVQFAGMSNIYASKVLGINNPKIALANIGIEEG